MNPRDVIEDVSWSQGAPENLRRALALARQRTGDEIARRRVWSRLAELPEERLPAPSRLRFVGVLAVLAGAAVFGGFWLMGSEAPMPSTTTAMAPPTPAPTVPAEPTEPTETLNDGPVISGPAMLRTGSGEGKRIRLRGGATAQLASATVLSIDAGHRATVERGQVSLEVARQAPGERFTVAAGPYIVAVIGTKFDVRVDGSANHAVHVDVSEGTVEIWRGNVPVGRVYAGGDWNSAPRNDTRRPVAMTEPSGHRASSAPGVTSPSSMPTSAPAPAPAPAPVTGSRETSDPFAEAEAAAAGGQPNRAIEILGQIARRSGPMAQNAAYEMGRVLRDRLLRPRDAVRTWNQYRERFPEGLLRVEADLSILETLVKVGDKEAALSEAEAFLHRYPRSERRAEVARVAEGLRHAVTSKSSP